MSRADGGGDGGNDAVDARDGDFPGRRWWQPREGTESGSLRRDEWGIAATDVTTVGDRCQHHHRRRRHRWGLRRCRCRCRWQ